MVASCNKEDESITGFSTGGAFLRRFGYQNNSNQNRSIAI